MNFPKALKQLRIFAAYENDYYFHTLSIAHNNIYPFYHFLLSKARNSFYKTDSLILIYTKKFIFKRLRYIPRGHSTQNASKSKGDN